MRSWEQQNSFYDTPSNKYKSPNHSSMEHYFSIAFQIKQESFKYQNREDFQARDEVKLKLIESRKLIKIHHQSLLQSPWRLFFEFELDTWDYRRKVISDTQPNLFFLGMSARPIEVAIHRKWKVTAPYKFVRLNKYFFCGCLNKP